jgi:four helix bundle protein
VAKVARFEDLEVWQTARELTKGVYRAARSQCLSQDRALADQMKRAAISIGSNIAEGFERGTRKQQLEFCYVAKGSAGELRSQIISTHDIELLDERAYVWLLGVCEKCARQLQAYIKHLRRTQKVYPGPKFAEQSGERLAN